MAAQPNRLDRLRQQLTALVEDAASPAERGIGPCFERDSCNGGSQRIEATRR